MAEAPRTHLAIDGDLVGRPVALAPGRASARLLTHRRMAADDRGLVHGGFVFGLADYAAMLAVNDPLVVLGGCEARFLAPVEVGEGLLAEAEVLSSEGRRRQVGVEVAVEGSGRKVFRGEMSCFCLERHVLEGA